MKNQNAQETIYQQVEKFQNETVNHINQLLADNIGSEWIVDVLGRSCLTIGVRNTNSKDFRRVKFGQEINITYKGWWKSEDRFDVNIGTTGCFSLLEGKDEVGRAEFYIGFAKFLANKEFQQELRGILLIYSDKEEELLNQANK